MQKSLIIKAVLAILSMIATAIGLGRNILGITELPMSWWPLATFIVFCVLVGWMIIGVYNENNRLLSNKPSINVEPMEDGKSYYLKVVNNGEQGIFKAEIELESEDDPQVWGLKNYTGYWRGANGGEFPIMKGHTGWVKIAERTNGGRSSVEHLNICFFDDRICEARYVSSSAHWIGATIVSRSGERKPMTKHRYKLRVVISANPSLREGVYKGRFRLSLDGLAVESG